MGVGNKRTLTKTRRHTRDLDQIKADLLVPKHLSQYQDTKSKEDLPGLGRWYCIECAKWYDTEVNLVMHRKGKPHKRRVKSLRDEPYTQKEAEAAAGLGVQVEDPSKATQNEVEMAT
ncbi:zinc finger protein [Astrocystis sublimbata]|nr:zinc finger protein [Astrocystis sublimbata]